MEQKQKTPLDEHMIPYEDKDWKKVEDGKKTTYRTAIQTHDVMLNDAVTRIAEVEAKLEILLNHKHVDNELVVPINFKE